MKKFIKVLCLVLVLMMVVAPISSFASSTVFPNDGNDVTLLATNDNAFSAYAKYVENSPLQDEVQNTSGMIYNILKAVGLGVAVCMTVYIGIQWMLATPAKKAELKGRLWSMVIGVILLVGGVAILGIVQNFANQATTAISK